jgi:hypothetical protein
MYREHVISKLPTLTYKGNLLMGYKNTREEMDITDEFVLPIAQYICRLWPLYKYPIIPRYINYDYLLEK